MWITRVSINHPVFATMVMVALAVLGLFAYQRLRVEQMPEVSLPFVVIVTAYPGASPDVVEADVTKPLEYAVNTVAGVKLIRSNSLEGLRATAHTGVSSRSRLATRHSAVSKRRATRPARVAGRGRLERKERIAAGESRGSQTAARPELGLGQAQ